LKNDLDKLFKNGFHIELTSAVQHFKLTVILENCKGFSCMTSQVKYFLEKKKVWRMILKPDQMSVLHRLQVAGFPFSSAISLCYYSIQIHSFITLSKI